MIKAVIFDFDDTLVHTYQSAMDDIGTIAEEAGLSPPRKGLLRKHYGKTIRETAHSLWPRRGAHTFLEKYRSLASTLRNGPPVRGAHEVIDMLSRRYVLGIVTGRLRNGFSGLLARAKIDFGKFSFIFTSDDIQMPKSDPHYFDQALRELGKMGIAPQEVLFVADSVHDYEAAQNAGIHFAGVLTGPTTREDLVEKGLQEGMIIHSVMDLPTFIQNNGFG